MKSRVMSDQLIRDSYRYFNGRRIVPARSRLTGTR